MILGKTYNLQSLDNLGEVVDNVIESLAENLSMDEKTQYNVKLVISELVINGFTHSRNNSDSIEVIVQLNSDNSLVITVDDKGIGFDASSQHGYTDVNSECGRGLVLVDAFSESIVYNKTGNRVQVTILL